MLTAQQVIYRAQNLVVPWKSQAIPLDASACSRNSSVCLGRPYGTSIAFLKAFLPA